MTMTSSVKVRLIDGTVLLKIHLDANIFSKNPESVTLMDLFQYLQSHSKILNIYKPIENDVSWAIVKKTLRGKWKLQKKLNKTIGQIEDGIYIANKKIIHRNGKKILERMVYSWPLSSHKVESSKKHETSKNLSLLPMRSQPSSNLSPSRPKPSLPPGLVDPQPLPSPSSPLDIPERSHLISPVQPNVSSSKLDANDWHSNSSLRSPFCESEHKSSLHQFSWSSPPNVLEEKSYKDALDEEKTSSWDTVQLADCTKVAEAGCHNFELCSLTLEIIQDDQKKMQISVKINSMKKNSEFLISLKTTVSALEEMILEWLNISNNIKIVLIQIMHGYERKIINQSKVCNILALNSRILVYEDDGYAHRYKEQYWIPGFVSTDKVSSIISSISCMQNGNKISNSTMKQMANLFFSQDPLFCTALKRQEWANGFNNDWQLKLDGCPSPIFEFSKDSLSQYKEYIKRVKIINGSSRRIVVELTVIPSCQDFLGYKQSCKVLEPYQESRINLYLVPLIPPITTGMIFITCRLFSGGEDKVMYYVIGYRSKVKPNQEQRFWHISLNELFENESQRLGDGSSGMVYSAAIYGKELASKVFKEQKCLLDMDLFHREVEYLRNPLLQHPNIVVFYGASDLRPFRLLTEKLECTLDYLITMPKKRGKKANSGKEISWQVLINIAIDLFSAMTHMHACGFMHRDLKSPNVMIDKNMHAKLTDLGSAEKLDSLGTTRGVVGTIPWMAPEVQTNEYGISADVYSFGVTLFEIASRKSLFDHSINIKNLELQGWIKEWYGSQQTQPELILGGLIMKCCQSVPEERCSTEDIYFILQKASSIAAQLDAK